LLTKELVHPVRYGKNVRMSYSRIGECLDVPNLIEIQKNSYDWFLSDGLKEVFHDISHITDFSGNLVLEFVDFSTSKIYHKPIESSTSLWYGVVK